MTTTGATVVGLVGDTHVPEAGPDLPAAAYALLAGCARILHCGDLHTLEVVDRLERIAPTLVSRGNGDRRTARVGRPGVPDDPRVHDDVVVEIAGLRIGMTHDLSHVEELPDARAAELVARRFGGPVDLAVSGHSHVPAVRGLDGGPTLVNPGSPTMPYGYLGITGTLARLEIGPDRTFRVSVVEVATGGTQLEIHGPGRAPLQRGARPRGGR